MRKFILLALVFFTSFTAFGQDFSNKGKDFWVGYGYHQQMLFTNCPQGNPTPGGCQDMVLYFATDQVTNISITIPGTGYSQNITTAAGNNVTTSLPIPKTGTQDSRLLTEGLSDKGIHITSDKPMVAYAHIYNQSVSGASILYPTNTLGREYYSVNYKNWSNSTNANCWFYVVATDTGTTTVKITPTGNTTGGWIAGVTYTITLTQGQVYNVMGSLIVNSGCGVGMQPPCTGFDLTGSKVESVNTGSGCKKIGVFSGSGRISISCDNFASSSDNYMVQAMPKNAWGKKYLTVPANGNQSNNFYRVCVLNPVTVVRINGVVTTLPLQGGFFYEIPQTNQPQLIEGDSAIMVAQYFSSQGECGNGNPGDPEVIYLSAVEQSINRVLWNATNFWNIASHHYNVVIPNTGTAISSFMLDGVNVPAASFVVHPQAPNYSYLRAQLTGAGPHLIQSDSGFNAIAYGFGNAESYGYNAGTNIKDLYQQIRVQTQYGIETTPSVCINSPFKFKVSLPYCPDSISWNLSNLPGPPPSVTMYYSTCTPGVGGPDSSIVINGRTVNWYSLPGFYSFSTVGVYPVTITTFAPNGECGTLQEIPFDLTVSAPPVADFIWTPGGCMLEPFQFTETTPQLPKPTYKFYWNFGDPGSGSNNTDTVRNPVHIFSAPGTYYVKYVAITTPGCFTDTVTKVVIVADLPTATISGNTTVCINTLPEPDITFTGALGTAPYTFSYTIDAGGGPGPIQNVNSVGNIAIIQAPTNVAGTFIYTLVSVSNTGSSLCKQNISGQSATVIVNPLPIAAIAGGTTVCLNSTSPPVTFTGSGSTAPYTFAYTLNGIPQAPVVSNGAGIYIINAPTNVVGSFIYTITSVTDASSTLCSSTTNVSTTIIVNDLPDAVISGGTTVCLNATQPTVTFTGSGGTAPYTFTYTINSVAQPPLVSNAVGIGTVNAPTNVAGTFTYALVSVQEGSPITCLRTGLTGTTVITVNPLPAAAIAGGTTVCLNSASPPVTFTGSGSTAPYTFTYTLNGIPQAPVVSNGAGIYIINAPTNVVGSFIYTITSVTDASSTLCSSTTNVSTTIIVNDLPDAVISGGTTVCLNATQPPVTFTGSGGTAPYTFNYTINAVAQPPLVSNAVGIGTVNAPTNVVGTFTYALVSVQEGSPITCLRTGLTGTTVITVNPLPAATISGSTEVCLNDASPLITFTGTGATAPYTFTYTINAVPQPPVVSNAAGIATVAVPTNVAGTFTYALVSVQDGSSTTCSQAQTGSATVIVNPLPTPNFIFTTPSCETRTISFTDLSVANVGILTNWTWNFGDGSPTDPTPNPTHVYATAGTYNVTLSVTNSKGCISNPIASIPITINDRPQAGFIIPEVCLSDTYAQFLDTSSIAVGTITAWEWYFDDPFATPGNPNTSNLRNPTHSYTAVGIYDSVQLIVTSALGCRDTIIQTLTVNGSFPIANFTVNNPATLCANDSVAIVEASTVFPGVITKIEIWFDTLTNAPPAPPDILDNNPFTGKVYRHLYPNFQTPLTKVFTIRYRAYSGGVCLNDKLDNITVNAAPLVQFNAIPDTCLLVAPFQITQAGEIGGVPGTGVFSGPGVSGTGIFTPAVAGIGTHTILYTFTSTVGGCVDTMSNTITVLDTAHAAFSYVLPACEQTPVSFTDLSTAPATVTLFNTVWDFGDGTPPEIRAPLSTFTHVFALPGTYTVSMYNVSAYGCNSTVTSQSITIDANHTISLSSAPGSDIQTVCINSLIAPIVYTLGGGATGANIIVGGLPPGVTYTVVGTTLTISGAPTSAAGSPYNFTLETTGNSCIVAQATGRITVDPDHAIALRAGGDTAQSVCVNTPIDPIQYDLGGGATDVTIAGLPTGVTYSVTGNILTISGTPTTTSGGPVFNYVITTTGNTCVWATAIGNIVVHAYPVPSFTVDKPSYCIPNAIVKFTNTTPNLSNNTYSWDFGDGSLPDQSVSPTHWYTTGTGPFTVTLSATSIANPILNGGGQGCLSTINVPMTSIHPQPKADFTFSSPSVCIGAIVTLTDNSDGKDGTINQWNWDLGDGSPPDNRRSFNYLYNDTITYNITLYSINSFGCISDIITKPFTVYPYPHVNAGPDRFILEGGTITLESVTFANDPKYEWTPNLYLVDNKVAKVKVHRPLTDMTYRLTVTGRGGCRLSDSVFVKLLKFPVIPNTFTPNTDGINDTWRIDYLNTYPNNRVQVFTRSGQLVFESRGYNTPWDGTIKGKALPFDTYYYIIEPGNGRDPITGYVTIIK